MHEAERHRQAVGDATPITQDTLWARAAADMSEKPYKALGIDLLNAARHDRKRAIDTFIKTHHAMEAATLADPNWGVKARERTRTLAVNEQLARHLPSLDAAIQENDRVLGETLQAGVVRQHLRAMRVEAEVARRQLTDLGPAPTPAPSRSRSMSPGP